MKLARGQFTPRVWVLPLMLALLAACQMAAAADPRNVRSGLVVPDEGYCDQPYVVVTRNGDWLCVLTTGKGQEGKPGQHVVSTISKDQGRNWSKPIDIEPGDGPEASWATPLLVPSGRVYVFYDYNGDKIRTLGDRPIRADMLGWYCYRYSDDSGESWSKDRFRLEMRVTACDRANDWQGQVQIFWGIAKPVVVGQSAYLPFTKLGKHLLDGGEGWFFRCDNILSESDPRKLQWQLLPEGEHGLRLDKFGSIQEEHNIVSLAGGDLFCIYRTTTGNPCQSYSRDGGATWSEPAVATYTPGGKPIKHPRACPKLWRAGNGRFLLWYHNHGGKSFQDRNPAWLCGGVEKDGQIHWSQGEILLYDDDPQVRMSYPDLIEQDGRYWITETQKTVARVHAIDPALLAGMWRQVEDAQSPAAERQPIDLGAAVLALDAEQIKLGQAALPRLPSLAEGGFSLELILRLAEVSTAHTLLDATDSAGRGWRVTSQGEGRLQIDLSDGKTQATWTSDKHSLRPGQQHHVVITVDGGPNIITFLVDGVVCDGGEERQFGWGRFDAALGDLNSTGPLKLTPPAGGQLSRVRIHARPLRNFEAVGLFRNR